MPPAGPVCTGLQSAADIVVKLLCGIQILLSRASDIDLHKKASRCGACLLYTSGSDAGQLAVPFVDPFHGKCFLGDLLVFQPVALGLGTGLFDLCLLYTSKLTALTSMPASVMRRSGFTERLVMPSKAKASIFFSG